MSDEPRKGGPIDAGDVIGAIGIGAITYGVWLIYRPAAFIVGGACLLLAAGGMAILKARR